MAETRARELRFTSKMDIKELGSLLKEGYNAGQRPVTVAFENVDLPGLICSKINLRNKSRTIGISLGGIVLDIIADNGLPMGTLAAEYNSGYKNRVPFSAYLIYHPVR